MKNPVYVSRRYFAKLQGVSAQRVEQLLEQGRVPGACKMLLTNTTSTWVIPEGTDWPEERKPGRHKLMAPHGFLSLREWAVKWGRSKATAYMHISKGAKIPGMISYMNGFFVPENSEWPWQRNRGRPRKVTATSTLPTEWLEKKAKRKTPHPLN